MSIKKGNSKRGRRGRRGGGGEGSIPIRSPKKSPPRNRGLKGLFTLFSTVSIVVIVLIFYACRHPGRDVALSTSQIYLAPLDRGEYGAIETINEEITLALAEMGIGPDSRLEREMRPRNEGELYYVELKERYELQDNNLKGEELTGYLLARLSPRNGDITGGYSELSDGGFELSIEAFDHSIRTLTFLPKPDTRPRIAIIMDDMGMNRRYWDDIFSFKFPITLSVFPHRPFSVEVATLAHDSGMEVMLHIPMEPIEYPEKDPGMGALFTFMSEEEIIDTLLSDLSSVPYISGVNNHMGSYFTQDDRRLEIVLEEVNKLGLFFVDSKTTSLTRAFDVAIDLGVPAFERTVFLDNDRTVKKIKKRIVELIEKAKRNGGALGICHPYPETIEALKEMEDELLNSNVDIITVNELIELN